MSSIETVYIRARPITDTLENTNFLPKLNLKSKSKELDNIVSEISCEIIEGLLSMPKTPSQPWHYSGEHQACEKESFNFTLNTEVPEDIVL